MTETHRYTNRLIHETSPYLLQHAHNPVDWYPWGEEAFQKAKAEDKPILLSCGYSACHWCHVMERESFEDPEIASLMNKYFINIKVDREERPDLDQLYQQAVQSMGAHGGWPLTVFLDCQGRPFYGGTYFPPVPMYGRMSFPELLEAIHERWTKDRERVDRAGNELTAYLNSAAKAGSVQPSLPGPELPQRAMEELFRYFDQRDGGFGGAPKFPNTSLLKLFLQIKGEEPESPQIEQVLFTLTQMARGGIYDQLGGGFHRYSTDKYWVVPHFEKMLYDNAQLLEVYSIGYQLTGSPEYATVAKEIAAYIRREMTDSGGGFYATQDADSEGVEGKFFVWDIAEIEAALTKSEAELVIDYYQIDPDGNFEGKNILTRQGPGALREMSGNELQILAEAREKLFKLREKRAKPFRDEKITTAWNGLMIGSLAYAYQVFHDPADLQSAQAAARFILDQVKLADGTLARTYKDGRAKVGAFLDDYAFLVEGLIGLYQSDFDPNWLREAVRLTETAMERFGSEPGLNYLASADGDAISRPLSGHDEAIPAGAAVQAGNLLKLAAFTGRTDFRQEAKKIFTAYAGEMQENSWGYARLLTELAGYFQDLQQFTFISDGGRVPDLLIKLRELYLPNRIIVWNRDQTDLASHPARDLLANRRAVAGKPTCYLCTGVTCQPPVTEWEKLYALATGRELAALK